MKLFQLQYFCTACLYRNITRAAETLHVSQPAVSMAIQSLEREFGVHFLDREERGFALTSDGEYFYRCAQSIIGQSNKLSETMAERRKSGAPILRFGATPMAGAGVTHRFYSRLRDQQGRLSVHLVEDGRNALLRKIDEKLLDFALVPVDALPRDEYDWLELGAREIVLCVSDHSPLAQLERIDTAETLRDTPLVMFDENYYFMGLVRDYFKQSGVTPHVVCYATQTFTAIEFVRHGGAAAFLLRGAASSFPEVVEISLAGFIPVTIGLVWKKTDEKRKKLEREIRRLARDFLPLP